MLIESNSKDDLTIFVASQMLRYNFFVDTITIQYCGCFSLETNPKTFSQFYVGKYMFWAGKRNSNGGLKFLIT